MAILTLNAGSSSLKFRLFGRTEGLPVLSGGKVSGIGSTPVFKTMVPAGIPNALPALRELPASTTQEDALDIILKWLEASGTPIAAVAHRIVHGGSVYTETTRLTAEVLADLAKLTPLAPLHQPHNLAGAHVFRVRRPDLPQYGCFDTAFHGTLSSPFTLYALPEGIRNRGVRRYGFHGLSYSWVSRWLQRTHPSLFKGRVVAAHLGNGSSLCAMHGGKSVDTTMGLTALEGLPMGTRCGNIDPGAVLYMQSQLGLSLEQTTRILYDDSGLKGLSGLSNDMQTLLAAGTPQAKTAIDYFVLKTAQGIAAMATSLGGMDTLVFTGGIGENATEVREAILKHLAFLPPFSVHTLPADEERAMAEDILALL